MALGFGQVPLEIVVRLSNQLGAGVASVGAELKALQASMGSAGGQLGLPGIGGGGAGMLGALGPTVAIAGGVAAVAGLAMATKSLVDTYRSEQAALSDLSQAYKEAGLQSGPLLTRVDQFIAKNQPYIQSITDVQRGFADLTRAGLDQNEAFKAVNAALDISTLRGTDFSTVEQQILLALEGNARGFKYLGINVKDFGDLTKSATQIAKDNAAAQDKVTAATETLSNAQRALYEDQVRLQDKGYSTRSDLLKQQDLVDKVTDSQLKLNAAQANYNTVVQAGKDKVKEANLVLDEALAKGKGGRETLDQLQQAQNSLNAEWMRFSGEIGPGLLVGLSGIVKVMDVMVQTMEGFFQIASAVIGLAGNAGPAGHAGTHPYRGASGPVTHPAPAAPLGSGSVIGRIGL